MATEFTIKQDDQLPEIISILKDSSTPPVIINLTGVLGVRFIMTNKATGTVKVDQPATIVDHVGGEVKYTWQTVDTDTPGSYNGEWEVEFSDGKLESFPNNRYIQIKVFADLGGIR